MQVSSRIREDLLQRAGEFNIKLEDVSITHLTFGKVSTVKQWSCAVLMPHGAAGIHTGTNQLKKSLTFG